MKKILYVLLLVPLGLWVQVIPTDIVKENTYTVTDTDTLLASSSIILKPNTWVKPGSTFRAAIVSTPYISLILSNENYILTRVFQIATSSETVEQNKGVIESVMYFDDLSRVKQSIAIKQSPLQKDIITHIAYDSLGRQAKEFLPYASNLNGGALTANALVETNSYYTTHNSSGLDTSNPNPYSEKVFENSPLSRLVEQAACVGLGWNLITGSQATRIIKDKLDDRQNGFIHTNHIVQSIDTLNEYLNNDLHHVAKPIQVETYIDTNNDEISI